MKSFFLCYDNPMEKFTQKWSLISLIKHKDVGYEFPADNWPLHVTIAATFEVDWEKSKVEEQLEELCAATMTFDAKVLEDKYLGPPEKPVLVALVEKNSGLQKFHEEVIDILGSAGGIFKRPEHNRDNYIAHATVQKNSRLKEGDVININNLTLVDMFPGGNSYRRKILKIIKLRAK